MNYDVVIVASGSGSRINLGYNKVFYRFDDGETILDKATKLFIHDEDCKNIIVVTNQENFQNVTTNSKLVVTRGGNLRKDSVFEGLKLVKSEYVLVHDGARPYLSKECLEDLKKALDENDAAILAVKAKDTIKLVSDHMIEKTLDRNTIYLAQTPQGARSNILFKAYQKAIDSNIEFTDEASILEYFNIKVKVVDGSYSNNKITFKEDLF